MTVIAVILAFIKSYWKPILIGVGILVVLIVVTLTYQSCKPTPHIDSATVNKINSADEKERKAELEKTVAENLDVIQTAEGATREVDMTVDAKNKVIADKVQEIEVKIAEAKSKGGDVTGPALECMLVSQNCK